MGGADLVERLSQRDLSTQTHTVSHRRTRRASHAAPETQAELWRERREPRYPPRPSIHPCEKPPGSLQTAERPLGGEMVGTLPCPPLCALPSGLPSQAKKVGSFWPSTDRAMSGAGTTTKTPHLDQVKCESGSAVAGKTAAHPAHAPLFNHTRAMGTLSPREMMG